MRVIGYLLRAFGRKNRVTLLGLEKDNPVEADRIWNGVQPGLAQLPAGEALALATQYAASLSARGRYSEARSILLKTHIEADGKYGPYCEFVILYWLNLCVSQFHLGDFHKAHQSMQRVAQEKMSPNILVRFESLQALLAYESGHSAVALTILRNSQRKLSFSAWLLAELGELPEAAHRLPPLEGLQLASNRCYHHLAQLLITGDPAFLEDALATGFATGMVAWHAVRLGIAGNHLDLARQKDPESHWTRRAEFLAR